jgi:hypothetical protein
MPSFVAFVLAAAGIRAGADGDVPRFVVPNVPDLTIKTRETTTAIVLTAAVTLIAPRAGSAQASGRAAVATTSQFVFYSDFATNVNDALIAAGVARRANRAEPAFNTPLRAALAAAARDGGGTVRGDLTHPVHFFMTGEAVRRVLERPGEPPYTPYLYAQGLFSTEFREAIKKTWPSYMDGKRTLQEAAADLIRALGK